MFPGAATDESPIDVLHVAPVESRPYHTLVTVGMSSWEMPVPQPGEAPRRLELMMTLQERWRLDQTGIWPVRLLQQLGRHPRERQAWLGWGHAIPNGDPPRPYARNTRFSGVILAPSLLVPVAFYELGGDNARTAFYGAIPLYREELELHQRAGMEALLTQLLRHDINDVVIPRRRNVAKRFFGLF